MVEAYSSCLYFTAAQWPDCGVVGIRLRRFKLADESSEANAELIDGCRDLREVLFSGLHQTRLADGFCCPVVLYRVATPVLQRRTIAPRFELYKA